jgi:hypothetical protein
MLLMTVQELGSLGGLLIFTPLHEILVWLQVQVLPESMKLLACLRKCRTPDSIGLVLTRSKYKR